MRAVFDIESNGLLDHTTLDYSTLPFRLKPTYRVWCAVFTDMLTGAKIRIRPHEIEKIAETIDKCSALIGHNIINFDLLLCRLYFGIEYDINEYDYTKCAVNGREVEIVDTLILSQYLRPDRLGGHSLKSWGERLRFYKGDYGEQEDAWDAYTEEMLEYCEQDVDLNVKVYEKLMEEWGKWKHEEAFSMEQSINHLVTTQEHVGFKFNIDKANAAVADLNTKLRNIEKSVKPHLPKITLAATNQAKYKVPARQIKKDGEPSADLLRWVDNHNAALYKDEYGEWVLEAYDKVIPLPATEREPLVTKAPMELSNQNKMKQYLVYVGWNPIVWNDRDLTLRSGTKIKVNREKYEEAVERYCLDTAGSHFKKYRLEYLRVKTVEEMHESLMRADITRPKRVYTSPSYTIDQDKTICPNLERLGSKYDWVKEVVLWLTYRHRRNMLLSPNGTGLLAHPRLEVDGRLPTGAQVTGTNTYRFKHRVCVNIPRPSSVYGAEIRELFECGEGMYQEGADAASLEGRVQGHYCLPYSGGKELAETLIAEKPNDIHTVRANNLGISRDDAKGIGYACTPISTTNVMTQEGWRDYTQLLVGDLVQSYNEEDNRLEWKPIIAIYTYPSVEVVRLHRNASFDVECTLDHKWVTTEGRVATKDLQDHHEIVVDVLLGYEGKPWLTTIPMREVTVVKSRHVDVFCLEVADNHNYVMRQGNTVTITGNCLYGAQPTKLSKMLGISVAEAQVVYDNFWNDSLALKQLKEKVEAYWERYGKSHLIGIDGRKVNTRSKHSLLNALFQSAGIILMKWAAIRLHRDLDSKGLLLDPFKHDSHKGKAAMMQHYHDEYQWQLCPTLVNGDRSAISEPMEVAMAWAGEHLGMRVPFAGEAQLGKNWRDCH